MAQVRIDLENTLEEDRPASQAETQQPTASEPEPDEPSGQSEPEATQEQPPRQLPSSPAAARRRLAESSARADAARKVLKAANALRIDDEATLGDLLAAGPALDSAVKVYLLGLPPVGTPRHYDDGTCQVVLNETLADFEETLDFLVARYAEEDARERLISADLGGENDVEVLSGTGTGAAPAEFLSEPFHPLEEAMLAGSGLPEYWRRHVSAAGVTAALRNARRDAMNRLGASFERFPIAEELTVGDFLRNSDQSEQTGRIFMNGAQTIGVRFAENRPVVEVKLTAPVLSSLVALHAWADIHYRGEKRDVMRIQQLVERSDSGSAGEQFEAIGSAAVPEEYLRGEEKTRRWDRVAGTNVPLWIGVPARAEGWAELPQMDNPLHAERLAMRRARIDARANLLRRLCDQPLSKGKTVGDRAETEESFRKRLWMTVLLADGQSRSLPFHPDRLGYSVSADTVGLWKSYAADVLSGQTQPAADMEPSPPEPAETQRPDAEATEASGEIPVEEQTDEEQTDEEQPVGETDGFSEPADRPATPKTETPAEQPEAKPDEPESRQDETPSEEDIPEILPVDAEQ